MGSTGVYYVWCETKRKFRWVQEEWGGGGYFNKRDVLWNSKREGERDSEKFQSGVHGVPIKKYREPERGRRRRT